ncbi:MAG: dihydroorotase [Myxococcota bacterium]
MSSNLKIRLPDDWHLHLRDGDVLRSVVADTAAWCGRAIVMPNLVPPVTTAEQMRSYRERILAALAGTTPRGPTPFEPLMTAYVTSSLTPVELREAHAQGILTAAKLYPAHATTHSASGLVRMEDGYAVFETLQELGVPLLVHGEVTDPDVDFFDREKVFIDRHLSDLAIRFPSLKIVLEHITTADAVEFVRSARPGIAATVTAHHMTLSRNDLFLGGLRPHHYCLPVAKRFEHRDAVRKAACSGDPRFFLGTDSAPHQVETKEADCGCAGIYSAPSALLVYLEAFEAEDALEHFEAFASLNGPAFYGLSPHEERISLHRMDQDDDHRNFIPETRVVGSSHVRVFRGGERARWRIERGP